MERFQRSMAAVTTAAANSGEIKCRDADVGRRRPLQNRLRSRRIPPVQALQVVLLMCSGQIAPACTDSEGDLVSSMQSNEENIASLGYNATLALQLADLKQLQQKFSEIRPLTRQASFDTSKSIMTQIASTTLLDGTMTVELVQQALSLLDPLETILFVHELSDESVQTIIPDTVALDQQRYSESLLLLIGTFLRPYFAGFNATPKGTLSAFGIDQSTSNVMIKAGRVAEQTFGPDVKIRLEDGLLSGMVGVTVAPGTPFATSLGSATYRTTQKLVLASHLVAVDTVDPVEDGCSNCSPPRLNFVRPLRTNVTVDLALLPSEDASPRMLLCGRFSDGKWVYSHMTTVGGRTQASATCILSSSRPSGTTIFGVFENAADADGGDDAAEQPPKYVAAHGESEESEEWGLTKWFNQLMEQVGWECTVSRGDGCADWPLIAVVGIVAVILLAVVCGITCMCCCCNNQPKRNGKVHPAQASNTSSHPPNGTARSRVITVAEQRAYDPHRNNRRIMDDSYNVVLDSSPSRASFGPQPPTPIKPRRSKAWNDDYGAEGYNYGQSRV